jgi:hypothetical protein
VRNSSRQPSKGQGGTRLSKSTANTPFDSEGHMKIDVGKPDTRQKFQKALVEMSGAVTRPKE